MKVFIIGAARSGTKILRDSLSEYSGEAKVPYDINFIWKWGNHHLEHDELGEDNYNLEFHNKIDRYLTGYQGSRHKFLIEKTVSNTIRVPFLLKHYPNAKFIFLYREPQDVIESVYREWHKSRKLSYVLNKIRHIPAKVLVVLLMHSVRRVLDKKQSRIWGVRYPGIDKDIEGKPLISVIVLQWIYCYEKAVAAESLILEENKISVTYEDFVDNPERTLKGICEKFGMPQVLQSADSLGIRKRVSRTFNLDLDTESLRLLASRSNR